jgi:hypothetical protein
VDELGAVGVPFAAVALCTVRYLESGPLLRRLIEKAADGALLGDRETRQLVRALYIVGGRRDPLVFEPLLRLLRRPPDEVDELLGDVISVALPRIVAGVFDGNAHALFEAIVDLRLDELVRDALLAAATFLTFDKRIELQRTVGFLGRFGAERAVPDGDTTWSGWAQAIALLGLRTLEPAVVAAFDREAIFQAVYRRKDFANELAAAEQSPADPGRFEKADLGYIEDVVAVVGDIRFEDGEDFLGDVELGDDDDDEDGTWPDDNDPADVDQVPASFQPTPQGPAVNPLRHVGRNDPCPCGSGKKAKRCCLRA